MQHRQALGGGWLRAGGGILGLVLTLLISGSAAAQATPPTRFYGTAYLNGQLASYGTVVQAYVGATGCGSGTVGSFGAFSVDVPSSVVQGGCGYDGATVTFTVAGLPAEQAGFFQTGSFIPIDLSTHGQPPALPPGPSAPLPPSRFFGTVYVGGQPLRVPSLIEAFVGDTRCGVGGVRSDATYTIDVATSAAAAGCGSNGAGVRFRIGGALTPQETGIFAVGGYTPLDLHVGITVPPVGEVIERRIPGSIRLQPDQTVRFADGNRPSNERRSHRVTNAGNHTAIVEDDGRWVTITGPAGLAVALLESRGADCGSPAKMPHVIVCEVDRRARITFTVIDGDQLSASDAGYAPVNVPSGGTSGDKR